MITNDNRFDIIFDAFAPSPCATAFNVNDANFSLKFNPSGGGGAITPATSSRLGGIKVGSNLSITSDGVLSVITTNHCEQDCTIPITAAGVYTEVGNIEVLLASL